MNEREYLRTLGFEVGDRGRFSLEMKQALSGFEQGGGKLERRSGKREDGLPEVEPGGVVTEIVPMKKMREERVLKGKTTEGYTIAFVMCFGCGMHMIYCSCEGGVKAPSLVISSNDPLVRV